MFENLEEEVGPLSGGVPVPSNTVISSMSPLLVGNGGCRVSAEERWLWANSFMMLQACVEPLSAFLLLPAQEGNDGRSFHSSWQLRVENDRFEGNVRKQSSCAGPQQTAPANPLH